MQARWLVVRPDLDVASIGVVGRILRAGPLILARCEAYLKPFGLTRAEFDLVSVLYCSDVPVSPGDLSRQLLFTEPATTKRLHRLESAGWIARRVNPDDARGFLIVASDAGRRRLADLLPGYLAFENSLIRTLDEVQRDDLAIALRRLLIEWDA